MMWERKEFPNSLDEVLEFIRALSEKTTLLSRRDAPKYLERDNGLQYSELELVREANRASIMAREAVDRFVNDLVEYYEENHPDETAEFNERCRLERLAKGIVDGNGGDNGGGGGGGPAAGGGGGGGG